MHAYSFHTYGKTGAQLTSTVNGLLSAIAAAHVPGPGGPPSLPLYITEHAAHTSGDWNGLPSTADSPFEASRLGSQVLRSHPKTLNPKPQTHPPAAM